MSILQENINTLFYPLLSPMLFYREQQTCAAFAIRLSKSNRSALTALFSKLQNENMKYSTPSKQFSQQKHMGVQHRENPQNNNDYKWHESLRQVCVLLLVTKIKREKIIFKIIFLLLGTFIYIARILKAITVIMYFSNIGEKLENFITFKIIAIKFSYYRKAPKHR